MIRVFLRSLGRFLPALCVVSFAGCGGGDSAPTFATQSDLAVQAQRAGATPFIAFIDLGGAGAERLSNVRYVIEGKPGHVSKPVGVRYSLAALQRRGYWTAGAPVLTVPVFGLYAGHDNKVWVELNFSDGSTRVLLAQVQTAAYADPTGVYTRPTVLAARSAAAPLDFDFLILKSTIIGPVIIDTDAQVRWVGVGSATGGVSTFADNGFVIGTGTPPKIIRMELDGTTTETAVASTTYTAFHHNLDRGKVGLLGEFDATISGVASVESILAEFSMTGAVLKEWDFAAILRAHMLSQGDDPSNFVRDGADWFHMNAAAYDPTDDSIIASSRESFVIKVDYATGAIKWILGDPTKYWYTFPSLRSKALTLPPGGLYPIGQHAVSVTSAGELMLFDNGTPSTQQPAGAPVGARRPYSAAVKFAIDTAALTARETWRFDYGQSVLSAVCSSAYDAGRSVLLNYAFVDAGARARIVGLSNTGAVAFDFQYASPRGCGTSWNAMPVSLGALDFQ